MTTAEPWTALVTPSGCLPNDIAVLGALPQDLSPWFQHHHQQVHPTCKYALKCIGRSLQYITSLAPRTQAVLGLATGSTPTSLYKELIRMHLQEGLSFANVVTFNLDEYYPCDPASLQSYVRFMHELLFDHIDIDKVGDRGSSG